MSSFCSVRTAVDSDSGRTMVANDSPVSEKVESSTPLQESRKEGRGL